MRDGRRRGASGGFPILLLLALLLMGVVEEDLTDGLGGALDLYTRKIRTNKCTIYKYIICKIRPKV